VKIIFILLFAVLSLSRVALAEKKITEVVVEIKPGKKVTGTVVFPSDKPNEAVLNYDTGIIIFGKKSLPLSPEVAVKLFPMASTDPKPIGQREVIRPVRPSADGPVEFRSVVGLVFGVTKDGVNVVTHVSDSAIGEIRAPKEIELDRYLNPTEQKAINWRKRFLVHTAGGDLWVRILHIDSSRALVIPELEYVDYLHGKSRINTVDVSTAFLRESRDDQFINELADDVHLFRRQGREYPVEPLNELGKEFDKALRDQERILKALYLRRSDTKPTDPQWKVVVALDNFPKGLRSPESLFQHIVQRDHAVCEFNTGELSVNE
jgi:hypothetical protein